jgi:uncharacterized protein (TIGR03083 family)
VERDRYLGLLAADGVRLRTTASTDLTALVPCCPGWTAGDVVTHTAEVYEHKLAAIALGGTRPDPWPPAWPADHDPLAWFDDALNRLLTTLTETDLSAPSWTWWPADQSCGFWLRRMAQETAVHRTDAEAAAGTLTPVAEDLAIDGIEEVLTMMLSGDWSDEPQPDSVGTVNIGGAWLVTMSETLIDVRPTDAPAAAEVEGSPSDLLLWLWGRVPDTAVCISGDGSVAAKLRERLRIATQ